MLHYIQVMIIYITHIKYNVVNACKIYFNCHDLFTILQLHNLRECKYKSWVIHPIRIQMSMSVNIDTCHKKYQISLKAEHL